MAAILIVTDDTSLSPTLSMCHYNCTGSPLNYYMLHETVGTDRTTSSVDQIQNSEMVSILLLLFSLGSASEERFDDGCSSHCTSKFDEDLSCWNKTAEFVGKTLLGICLRYVTTQGSVNRMLKRMEYYHSNKNTGGLTAEIINKTIVTFIAASFEAIKVGKQPALLPCPQGCEKSSNSWFLWSFISLLLSGILTAVMAMKTLEKDRNHGHAFDKVTVKAKKNETT